MKERLLTAMPDNARQITGDDIISELLRNQQSGLLKLRYTVLAPCVYHVYLHPDDYDYLRPVARHLLEEATQALEEQLGRWNREGVSDQLLRFLGVGAQKRLEYKITQDIFTVEFHADEEEKLERGDIEIYSELGSEPREDLGEGERTRLITKRAADGHTSERKEVVAPTERVVPDGSFAVLRYRDDAGDREYFITKETTVLGRGGKSFWVDVKLEAPSDVSREHCRIRRDPMTGTFFLKDLSQFGTSVDGKPVPSSLEVQPDGSRKDNNVEAPLPERARISLAGMVEIDFERTGRG